MGAGLKHLAWVTLGLWAMAAPMRAQEIDIRDWPTLNMFGMPGIVEMPNGRNLPDGELAAGISHFAGMTRFQLTAQLHPRITGGFRYVAIEEFNSGDFESYYDRSFDLRFTLLEETRNRPEITLGLRDFIGTGIYGAEYLVASKKLGRRVDVSVGLGWGRLAGDGVLPGLGERPELTPEDVAEGGNPNFDTLFRGDIGVFGGIEWRPRDNWLLKAEYSSDKYTLESDELGIFERKSPFNFGIEYQPGPGTQLGAYYLYGSEIGVRLAFALNPTRPPFKSGLDSAPTPVAPRPDRAASPAAYSTEWSASQPTRDTLRGRLAQALIEQGLEMEALRLSSNSAELYLRNMTYPAQAQAMGRAARLMAGLLPSSVDTFTIVPVRAGMALPAHSFRRSDLEQFEIAPDGSERMLAATAVGHAPVRPEQEAYADGLYPRFIWRLTPYVRTSLFDPDNPLRADFGLALGAGFELAPGLFFTGAVRKRLVGNLAESDRESDSVLPPVRTDYPLYDKNGDPGIQHLQGAYYFQPGQDLYGRVTAGYLETMFAGLSSELLWAPYDSRFALGAELNYVRQRDFEGGFGLQDYDVVTGHASLYYRFTDDFFAQVDAGRYLAGDYGATFTLERVFANGWRFGAFATFTDVSAEDFGEGSFDKGITLSVPLGWFTGRSNGTVAPLTIRPVQRDGGARLIVEGRLYDLVEDAQKQRVEEQWGRFWR